MPLRPCCCTVGTRPGPCPTPTSAGPKGIPSSTSSSSWRWAKATPLRSLAKCYGKPNLTRADDPGFTLGDARRRRPPPPARGRSPRDLMSARFCPFHAATRRVGCTTRRSVRSIRLLNLPAATWREDREAGDHGLLCSRPRKSPCGSLSLNLGVSPDAHRRTPTCFLPRPTTRRLRLRCGRHYSSSVGSVTIRPQCQKRFERTRQSHRPIGAALHHEDQR